MTNPAERPNGAAEPTPSFEADWTGANAAPVAIANVFLAQLGANASNGRPDGLYLTAGHIVPPALTGPQESVARAVEELGGRLPVKIETRLYIPRDRIVELARLLQDTVEKLDAIDGADA